MPKWEQLKRIDSVPAELLPSERVLLYALVAGLRPERCLEIGTHTGGSAAIIITALDEVGRGRLACIDPNPQITPDLWLDICGRATLITGLSPDAISDAADAVGGRFNLAFIDGDHSMEGVRRDIEGVLPWLEDAAYLLFHDVHFSQVSQAIAAALQTHPRQLTDCGVLTKDRSPDPGGNPVIYWGGLQLVRFDR